MAVIWGSLHSTYPQQPFFIRALEVSLIGLAAGWVLLRWGLLATMLTHYIGNASIVGALFLLSGNGSLQLAAAAVVGLPLVLFLPALGAWLRGGRLPNLPPQPAPPAAHLPVVQPRPLGAAPRTFPWLVLPLLGGVGLLAALAPSQPGDRLQLAIGRHQAIAQATHVLEQLSAPTTWPIVLADVRTISAGADATYLLRTVGPTATTQFFATVRPPAVWQVRFARPLQQDEVSIQLGPSGELAGFLRQVEEAATGASPTLTEAQQIAFRWLANLSGRDDWTLVSAGQTRRDQRVDSSFLWERPDWRAGEATLRAQVLLYGNELGAYLPFVKLPEAFLRDLQRETTLESTLRTARDLLPMGTLLALALLFLRAFRRGETDLRVGWLLGLLAGGSTLLTMLFTLPKQLSGYVNTLDLTSYTLWLLSGRVREALLLGAATFALGALAPALLRRAGHPLTPPCPREVAGGLAGALALFLAPLAAWTLRNWLAPATLRAPSGLPPFDGTPAVPGSAGERIRGRCHRWDGRCRGAAAPHHLALAARAGRASGSGRALERCDRQWPS
ncbi:MAG: hypothetical protein KatS3mg061_1523 [Dehalococcoidia bacterium]|nr:MAG: hypothetical protein KatS3mg061_1523 [Dehalococcoidia bacterium]